jgi:hypothetical protein
MDNNIFYRNQLQPLLLPFEVVFVKKIYQETENVPGILAKKRTE